MKNFGNSSCGRSQGVPKFFRAPTYRAHCAVIFAIAQLSHEVPHWLYISKFTRLRAVSRRQHGSYLFQRLSVAVQRFSAASLADVHSFRVRTVTFPDTFYPFLNISVVGNWVHWAQKINQSINQSVSHSSVPRILEWQGSMCDAAGADMGWAVGRGILRPYWGRVCVGGSTQKIFRIFCWKYHILTLSDMFIS